MLLVSLVDHYSRFIDNCLNDNYSQYGELTWTCFIILKQIVALTMLLRRRSFKLRYRIVYLSGMGHYRSYQCLCSPAVKIYDTAISLVEYFCCGWSNGLTEVCSWWRYFSVFYLTSEPLHIKWDTWNWQLSFELVNTAGKASAVPVD